jgi:hypothetical protein
VRTAVVQSTIGRRSSPWDTVSGAATCDEAAWDGVRSHSVPQYSGSAVAGACTAGRSAKAGGSRRSDGSCALQVLRRTAGKPRSNKTTPARQAGATAHAAELLAALRQDTLFRIVLCFRGLGLSQIHPFLLRRDTDRTLVLWLFSQCPAVVQCMVRMQSEWLWAGCQVLAYSHDDGKYLVKWDDTSFRGQVWHGGMVSCGVVWCGSVLYGMSTHCEYPQYRDETRLDETRLNPKPTAATRGLWAI